MTQEVSNYYNQKVDDVGITGAGLVWYLGQDHLSPSYINSDEIALCSSKWREGVSKRVQNLLSRMRISPDDIVLDLGTGIGGPGRDSIKYTGCNTIGVNISYAQLATLRSLSPILDENNPYTTVVNGDIQQLPFKSELFDHAFSINMMYHVPNPGSAIAEVSRILKKGGKFGLDDWFLTENTTDMTANNLRYQWSAPTNGFHSVDCIKSISTECGLSLIDDVDYSDEAGAFLTEERFGKTFDFQVRPILVDVFPHLYKYDGYVPEHAELAATELRNAIMYMGELYRSGEAAYRQLIFEK